MRVFANLRRVGELVKKVGRLARVAAAIALVGGLTVVMPSTAAHADVCRGYTVKNSLGGWDEVRDDKGTIRLRTGPYGSCSFAYSNNEAGRTFYYWCQFINAYGNIWYFVRIEGTNRTGWIWEGSVYFWGSQPINGHCDD